MPSGNSSRARNSPCMFPSVPPFVTYPHACDCGSFISSANLAMTSRSIS